MPIVGGFGLFGKSCPGIASHITAFEGKSFSDFARDAIFEKIEDTYDLQELRGAVVADTGERHSQAQVLAELGL